jgi:Kef-type K+ transport systems, membrane components
MNETSLALTALIFLGAAIIMVPLVRKLGLSAVIGYILGGIIIGPFCLKLTGNDTDDIMHAAEFGVIMLLFLVGLEIEPRKFWTMRKRIIGMGLSQMVLTVVSLFLIFYVAKWRPDQALVAALCFALSSTAIVLQTLKEKNIFRTQAGEASFSILLFQDIAVFQFWHCFRSLLKSLRMKKTKFCFNIFLIGCSRFQLFSALPL